MITKIFRIPDEPPILTEEDLKSFQLTQVFYRQTSVVFFSKDLTGEREKIKESHQEANYLTKRGETYEMETI